MSSIKYTNERLGKLRVIPDFLPPPSELVFREDGVKVTISLSRKSVDFFKAEARKHRTPYQRMIRWLLDTYAERYLQSPMTGQRMASAGPGRRRG